MPESRPFPIRQDEEEKMFNSFRNTYALSALLASTLTVPLMAQNQGWPQWMANASHTGTSGAAGQGLKRILADVVYDPTVPQERAISGGSLLAHYQAPLTDGDRVFMEYLRTNPGESPYMVAEVLVAGPDGKIRASHVYHG